MPLKLRKNNSLELGSVYNYEDRNYLIIRSDYEKSKAYEIFDLDNINTLSKGVIKNFYNEDSVLVAKPKLTKKQGKSFKVGDFIMQDGLIYVLDEANENELVFTDFPKSTCPIYFFSPLDSSLMQLKSFEKLGKNEKQNPILLAQKEMENIE